MSIDAVTNVSSDVGSPMSGAIDPGSARRISELGSTAQVQGKMQRLDGPAPQPLGEVKAFDAASVPGNQDQMIDLEALDAPGDDVEAPQELQQVEEVDPSKPTPEQLAKEYQEFLDNPEIDVDKHGEKVMWYDADGKGTMVPIRLKDLPNNILLYNDYQRKTTEVAERNRILDRKENGQKQFIADLASEDGDVQLRAARQMMNPKGLEAFVLKYIDERARIEKYDPVTQQQILDAQRLADENFYLKRMQDRQQQQQQAEQQRMQQEQGAAAPDIAFVQQTIMQTLPESYKQLGISEAEHTSDAFQYELDRLFTMAASGERNPDGTWKVAPTIMRGRAPSKQLITNLVLQTKQRVDAMMASPKARRLSPPRKIATNTPNVGTGPAPGQGERGNISAPQRMRWSEMGRKA